MVCFWEFTIRLLNKNKFDLQSHLLVSIVKNIINDCIFNLDYIQINGSISALKYQLKWTKLNYKYSNEIEYSE